MDVPDRYEKREYILAGVSAFLVLGVIGGILQPGYSYRTAMGCPCSMDTGEIECNQVTSKDPLFFTGLVNVVEEKTGNQVITCSEGAKVDEHTEFENRKIELKILGFTVLSL